MTVTNNIEKLSEIMGFSPYQLSVLKNNADKYNVSHIVKRGGVLYVPHATKKDIFNRAADLLLGHRADLIGQDKILLSARRSIKFYVSGYHSVRIGDDVYYANPNGHVISRAMFHNAIKNHSH